LSRCRIPSPVSTAQGSPLLSSPSHDRRT